MGELTVEDLQTLIGLVQKEQEAYSEMDSHSEAEEDEILYTQRHLWNLEDKLEKLLNRG